jgi:hypothetical protein
MVLMLVDDDTKGKTGCWFAPTVLLGCHLLGKFGSANHHPKKGIFCISATLNKNTQHKQAGRVWF